MLPLKIKIGPKEYKRLSGLYYVKQIGKMSTGDTTVVATWLTLEDSGPVEVIWELNVTKNYICWINKSKANQYYELLDPVVPTSPIRKKYISMLQGESHE